jgi:hypothetical protein
MPTSIAKQVLVLLLVAAAAAWHLLLLLLPPLTMPCMTARHLGQTTNELKA